MGGGLDEAGDVALNGVGAHGDGARASALGDSLLEGEVARPLGRGGVGSHEVSRQSELSGVWAA